MKQLIYSLLLLIPATQAMAQSCTAVETYRVRGGVLGAVSSPGSYCLESDLEQPVQFDIHAMTKKSTAGSVLLTVRCTGSAACRQMSGADLAKIDLQGRTLQPESQDMVGIATRSWRGSVAIQNGTLRLPGSRDNNIGIDLYSDLQPLVLADGTRCSLLDLPCGSLPRPAGNSIPPAYKASRYLVDRVNVHAGTQGIRLIGHGSTVRNSVIEVDGWRGLTLYGGQGVIEGNTIIVHAKGDVPPFAAAITLRDAEGSVLRNNRIIFKGTWLRKAPSAIRLVDSSGVKLEGNTFEGFDELVQQAGESNYRMSK